LNKYVLKLVLQSENDANEVQQLDAFSRV